MPNEKRPLLEKIEEIKARHIGDSPRTSKNDVEIMYKKEALAKALASMDKTRQKNMQQWKQMKERQQAAFMAMMQTQQRQKQGGQPQQGPPQQGAQPGQGGGLLQAPPPQQPQQQGPGGGLL